MELFRELNKNLKVGFKRAISSPKVLIFIGISLIMPILIIVMTSMNASDGNGAFTNAWQILGCINQSSAMSMDLTSMCNINLVFILALVFSNLFIGEDFTSGFYKNIFSIRTSKITYCLSKIIVTTFFSMLMFISFFVGGLIASKISGLSFALGDISVLNIVCCIISKILFMVVFTSIATLASVIAKNRTWMSILICLAITMLLFNMIPMITPLRANIINVILCIGGSLLFSIGFTLISNLILQKTDISR